MEKKNEHTTVTNNNNVESIENDFLKPIGKYSPLNRLWIGFLLIIVVWGAAIYIRQIYFGLGTTAMRNYVSWGLYISTFVFFIGISHSGTLVSAILRITNKEWRRPITRSAELLTWVSLLFGGIMPIIDMGRPDRIPNLVIFGRLQSPLLWDIICIGTYFVGSSLFLYLPMIPDIALCRDRLSGNATRLRKWIYRKLSLGWQDTPGNWKRLEKGMHVMTIIIIPIAVSVHTVVGYIFAMTLRPGWNSTVFGPYFVAGALYSGSAAVVLIMAAFRRMYHLEKYITKKQFNYMGQIVLALTLIYAYFNLNEYAVPAYKMASSEGFLLHDLFSGSYSSVFWILQLGTVLVPAIILAFPKGRTPVMASIVCIIIVIGAWVKRYIIVIPTLLHPYLPIQKVPIEWSQYFPNWVEWSITFGALAGIFLVITLFAKIFPIVSIWEVKEGREIEEKYEQVDNAIKNEKENVQVATS
ncbi:molybdopterin oxidoreductase membrane subunit [Spirochaetia bacterium]|uniref:NrfD/PsrC family molybdoenzyme membrane anchor subunit n=1 Tax=Hydrotalea TaxID=1004300 RepID=UPI000944DD5C|nr:MULTISPECIES: NrfD/PsrC family molybdoenzyme membrane anchor subunit [Hydrotalea]RWZ88388.1 MAG: polysulfide reductase [Hydrotalea sp. AMD]GHV25743.1 molybdopterin oxidoreductase membrane subunit [Spirochaetia bacterium]